MYWPSIPDLIHHMILRVEWVECGGPSIPWLERTMRALPYFLVDGAVAATYYLLPVTRCALP